MGTKLGVIWGIFYDSEILRFFRSFSKFALSLKIHSLCFPLQNPPKEQTTTNAAAVAGSAEPSSQPPPRQQPKQTVSSTTPQRNSPNESESLRTLAAAPSERASDRRVSDGGGPSKIAKTADALLSSDLAVPGETSARLTVPASDQAVPSNRYERVVFARAFFFLAKILSSFILADFG